MKNVYRSGTVNSKSFVGNISFEISGNFKNEMIEKIFTENSYKNRIKWNFELTVFELTVPDLCYLNVLPKTRLFYLLIYHLISRVIDSAASQLTKTAITVTAIFIVALGYDLWHYLLGHLGVTEYIYNSPKQKYGMQ